MTNQRDYRFPSGRKSNKNIREKRVTRQSCNLRKYIVVPNTYSLRCDYPFSMAGLSNLWIARLLPSRQQSISSVWQSRLPRPSPTILSCFRDPGNRSNRGSGGHMEALRPHVNLLQVKYSSQATRWTAPLYGKDICPPADLWYHRRCSQVIKSRINSEYFAQSLFFLILQYRLQQDKAQASGASGMGM